MDVCNINLKIKYDENPYFDKPNEGINCMLIYRVFKDYLHYKVQTLQLKE
jgi:hypothetical protein